MTLKVFKLTTNLLELTSNLLGLTTTPCPPGELVDADSNSEVIKGQANRPGGWLHAPAYLELFAAAEERPTVRVKSAPPLPRKLKRGFPGRLPGGGRLPSVRPVDETVKQGCRPAL
jgi:hypothetical protein